MRTRQSAYQRYSVSAVQQYSRTAHNLMRRIAVLPTSRHTGSLKPGQAPRRSFGAMKGQAMVMVILVTVILVSVTGLAVSMVVSNALSTTRVEQGQHALEIAESGAEEALLRLLRDPTYTTSTPLSLTVDDGSATVDITGSGTKTITSSGAVSGYVRRIQVTATYASGQLTITSWGEN